MNYHEIEDRPLHDPEPISDDDEYFEIQTPLSTVIAIMALAFVCYLLG